MTWTRLVQVTAMRAREVQPGQRLRVEYVDGNLHIAHRFDTVRQVSTHPQGHLLLHMTHGRPLAVHPEGTVYVVKEGR